MIAYGLWLFLSMVMENHSDNFSISMVLCCDVMCDYFVMSIKTYSQLQNVKSELSQQEIDQLYKFVELELRGNDPAVLKKWSLKKPHHERYTVLKCYEYRTYYSFVQYKYLTGSTADTLLEYIERNLPEGVALKATKVAAGAFYVEIQSLPDYLTPPKEIDP
ncbi:hypothetical protein NQ317_006832 [Molorchus minor]|uniref:Small ribosomal subunit protein uS10m n=1 Tax=Molorchus minor TaxID=1323400 RepID=A0ABQ9K1T0_9CUCU|nr:hypothetical protein NQ317_006832 [Molorchus minor]